MPNKRSIGLGLAELALAPVGFKRWGHLLGTRTPWRGAKPPSEATLNKTATALCASAGEMQDACFKDMCAIGGDATDQIATNYETALATSVMFESIVSGP